ncbi:MAG: lipopolysaccharide heptosyltransferase I [Gammaproteobacteria bacterium]|nr:lipopolysaccharide heptosyltransferase I [Gammaproteobacteria bacterium]MBT4494046.1 lipopolysaccharide heptosyltransferase I [Gammaproteobacteria bacterium]
MNILIVKTSSLGDVIHALPAVTEAVLINPTLHVTWVVEESFAEIPRLHPGVDRVLPVAIRRWRRSWLQSRHEIRAFVSQLRDTKYDLVIDSQGLIKSSFLSSLSRGVVHGFDRSSSREALSAIFYDAGHRVSKRLHAVQRQKRLFAACLGYQFDETVDYGLTGIRDKDERKVFFLHGTTWSSKEWPVSAWQSLASLVNGAGYEVLVPAGNPAEKAVAESIVKGNRGRVLDRLPLAELATELSASTGVVSVDTGLGHLATALGIPLVGIFGATDPSLTAMSGGPIEIIVSDHLPCIPCKKRACQFPKPLDSSSIYPPCLEQTTPEKVWQALQLQIGTKDTRPG